MKAALFRKEFRYGIGRLLALPLLCIAVGFGLYAIQSSELHSQRFSGLFSEMFQAGTSIGCALIGLACGLWQAFRETKPGAWAFLVHRPVSASRLFLSKLAAALIMYVIVVGIPIAGAIAWAATPGNLFGPWLWAMAVPPLMDLLAGSAYVLVGLLIAVREARWFGSRIFPIGLGICVSVFAWAPWLWAAALGILLGWLVLLPASWSAFATRGIEQRQRRPARFAVALTLVPAAVALPILLAMLVLSVCEFFEERAAAPYTYAHYYQLRDGDLYNVDTARPTAQSRLAVNAEGNLATDTPWVDARGTSSPPVMYAQFHEYQTSYREERSYFGMQQLSSTPEQRRYFYMRQENLIREYVKSPIGRPELRGYIGSNGYSPSRGRAVPFVPSIPTYYQWAPLQSPIVEPGRVLQLDLNGDRVMTVFTTPAGERALAATYAFASSQSPKGALLTVATDLAAYLVDSDQKVLLRRAHESGYAFISVTRNEELGYFGLLYTQTDWRMPQLYVRVSADGEILARVAVPPQIIQYAGQSRINAIAEGTMIPPAITAVDAVHSLFFEKLTWKHALCLIPALIGAVANLLLMRRDASSRGWTVFWTVVGALGGFAGILLLFCTHTFSPRVLCGACRKPRVVRHEVCEHCGAPAPVPDVGGIAIFDEVACAAAAQPSAV